MISVLIPVYNYDVNDLVKTIHHQFTLTTLLFEIIILDDGSASKTEFNHRLNTLKNVYYYESQVNKGRIESRLKLAGLAKYDWLLFLDSDSKIIDHQFIYKYSCFIDSQIDVIIGGRTYHETSIQDCQFRLHWKYGLLRESKISTKRSNPYLNFMSNNFMIKHEVFKQLNFQVPISGYGHEDTLMGMQFERMKSKLIRINNPVIHDGLESVDQFLIKTKNALNNLLLLSKTEQEQDLERHVRLYYTYKILKKARCLFLFDFCYLLFERNIEKNLRGCNPSLFYFDLFKLYSFIQLMKKDNQLKME